MESIVKKKAGIEPIGAFGLLLLSWLKDMFPESLSDQKKGKTKNKSTSNIPHSSFPLKFSYFLKINDNNNNNNKILHLVLSDLLLL